MHNLKVENYVLCGGHSEDVSLGHSISDGSEGRLQRGQGEARTYGIFAIKTRQSEHQKIAVNKRKPDVSS